MSKPSKEKAVCKTCQHMEPEFVKCGRSIFYCMHPEAKRDVILKSELYADIKAENDKEREKARPLYDRFCEFAEKIENRLEESEVATLYEFLDEISELEEKEE